MPHRPYTVIDRGDIPALVYTVAATLHLSPLAAVLLRERLVSGYYPSGIPGELRRAAVAELDSHGLRRGSVPNLARLREVAASAPVSSERPGLRLLAGGATAEGGTAPHLHPVAADGRPIAYILDWHPNRSHANAAVVRILCPHCGLYHHHGAEADADGRPRPGRHGHRMSHCRFKMPGEERGYSIIMPDPWPAAATRQTSAPPQASAPAKRGPIRLAPEEAEAVARDAVAAGSLHPGWQAILAYRLRTGTWPAWFGRALAGGAPGERSLRRAGLQRTDGHLNVRRLLAAVAAYRAVQAYGEEGGEQ